MKKKSTFFLRDGSGIQEKKWKILFLVPKLIVYTLWFRASVRCWAVVLVMQSNIYFGGPSMVVLLTQEFSQVENILAKFLISNI